MECGGRKLEIKMEMKSVSIIEVMVNFYLELVYSISL